MTAAEMLKTKSQAHEARKKIAAIILDASPNPDGSVTVTIAPDLVEKVKSSG